MVITRLIDGYGNVVELSDSVDMNTAKWNGKKFIVDGDSLTHAGQWHTWLAEWLAWGTVYNHACYQHCFGNELCLRCVRSSYVAQ